MSTFTVYCHGTGFNRSKGTEKNELVAWLHNHTIGGEAILAQSRVWLGSYMINEGPGHGGAGGIDLPQFVSPITGDTGNVNKFSKWIGNKLGNIKGTGWDENVLRTLNIIQELQFTLRHNITRVNLVGWSRGAVTCIRIADAMLSMFGTSIECNILGIDPVAGLKAGQTMEDTKKAGPNVARYIAVLAMHEMRRSFKPQDWSRFFLDPAHTQGIMLPMPGVHSAQVIPSNPVDSAYITRNLACACLEAWGTQLSAKAYAHLSSPEDMCEAYGRLVLALSEHSSYQSKGIGNRAVGGGLRRRAFATHSKMDLYTRGGKESYWINEHHRACFEAAYGAAYAAIFGTRQGPDEPLSKVDPKLWRSMTTRTATRDSLMAKGLLHGDGLTYTIGIGAGNYGEYAAAVWPAGFPLHT